MLVSGMVGRLADFEIPIQPGVAELLREVADSGIPYALVSASVRPIVDLVLAFLARSGLPAFPVSVAGDEVARSKPDPMPYLRAAELLGVDISRAIILEDSLNGVRAGEAAGGMVVAVPRVVPIDPGGGWSSASPWWAWTSPPWRPCSTEADLTGAVRASRPARRGEPLDLAALTSERFPMSQATPLPDVPASAAGPAARAVGPDQGVRRGRDAGRSAALRGRGVRRGPVHRHHGPLGIGQVHAHALHGRPGLRLRGKVFIGESDLTTMKDNDLTRLRRERMGFVFQAFNLVPTLTAEENITLPLDIAGRKVDREWFDLVVGTVGLADRLSHKPSELSGGQQQRVACARAMATRPDIIFADEPTGNLDSRSGAEVLGFLRRSVDEFGQTILMVTHDAHAAAYADRVVFLADGAVVDELLDPNTPAILERMMTFEQAPGAHGSVGAPPSTTSPDSAAEQG